MYQTNQAFLEAMDDISRTLTVQVEIGGVNLPTESIIDFELERGAFDGDVFTIGQTLSSALTLTIFTTSSVKLGDEVKLFTDLLVGDSYVRVPMGIYYVDSTSVNQEKMTLTCYDKMVSLVEEYIPSGDHKTLAALFNDVRTQIGMKYDGAFTDVAIKQPLYGYTYRETLGFIASLNGGNMTINRSGNLEIQGYQEVERHIPAKTCFSFDVKEGYHVSKVFCLFGDVGISRGDNTGQCVSFENPYVTEQNIDVIYKRLKGLRFTAGSLKYRGDLTLDPGDLFTFTDYKGDEYRLMCGRNKLTFNGGLSGQLESIGESENSNVYAEHQLKYKKNMTKVTAELGKIQAIVQEIEQSHDGLEERVKKAELEMTADAITSKIKDSFVSKDEVENLVTQEELTSAISQTTDDITLQVSSNYETKESVTTKINNIQVGGTNLVLNSDFTSNRNNWSYTNAWIIHTTEKYKDKNIIHISRTGLTADSWVELLSNKIDAKEGETFTMSLDIKWENIASGEESTIAIWGYDSNGANRKSLKEKRIGGSQDWDRVVIAGTVPTGVAHVRACISHKRNGGIYATNFKLERGNKPTDWTPAPEDVAGDITKAKTDAISSANSTLTETIKDYYTKTQTDSAINVAKDAINLSVSNTYETKSNVTTKVNSAISTAASDAQTKANTALSSAKTYADTKKTEAINSAKSTLTETIKDYYTKSQTNSAIQVAKEEINLGVSTNYETKENVTTLVSSASSDTLKSAKSYADTKKSEAISSASTDATNKVNAAKSELNTAIGKKANSADVYTKSETYTKAQTDSAIQVAKDAINLSVSTNYETKESVTTKVNSAISTAASDATNKVNAVQIGGRNLLKNSAGNKTTGWTLLNGKGTGDLSLVSSQSSPMGQAIQWKVNADGATGFYLGTRVRDVEQGEVCSSSVWVKANRTIPVRIGCEKGGQKTVNVTPSWQKVTNTFTVNSNQHQSFTFYVSDPATNSKAGDIIFVHSVKLEVGNKPTDWTPAPEDVAGDITKAKTDAISSANSTLTETIKDYYTKTQTDSAINVAKDAINLSVSNTYETKESVTTKVNSAISTAASDAQTKANTALSSAKTYADTKKTEAINSANNTTTEKLKSYSTTSQMNSAISVAKNEINSSVSNTYTTKTDFNNAKTSITSLQTRMNAAEQKITDAAITSTVKQNFYTKEETNNQITSKGYQTASQVQQTVDALQVKFTESGGYNRILNGCFKKGTKSWVVFGTPTVSVITDASCGYDYSLKIITSTTNQGCQQKVDNLVIGKPYTFSSYAYGKSGACGIQVNNGGTYSSALLTKSDTWERLSVSFVASATTVTLQLGRGAWGSNGTHYFVAAQLEEGEMVSPYIPHSSEIYDGITTIDRDGVEVEGTNVNTKTQMTADGFKIIRKSDNKELFNASNGNLTMEGTLRTSSSGLRVEASGTDYKIYDGNTMKGFFGFNELGSTRYKAPRIYLAVDGVTATNSHFSLTHYGPLSSPLNTGISYVDFAYYSADLQDYSNIYMSGNSEIKIAPLLGLDIDTHCKLGQYTGKTPTNLAKFLSTKPTENKGWYDGTLRIESISNTTNPYGLILADNRTNGFAAVSVYADSNGGKHFSPCGNNNTSCGDATYKWNIVYSNNGTIQTCDERFKVKRGYSDVEDCYNMVKNVPLYNYVMLEQSKEELSKNRLGKLAMINASDDAKVHMGIMAQDLQQYDCGRHILVGDTCEKTDSTTDTTLHINPLDMTMALMGALKVEIEKRETLEKRLALLENKLNQLETLLA